MGLSVDDILNKSNLLIQETTKNSIPPARVGELIYGLAELIKQGSGNASVVGVSKLSELSDVAFLGLKKEDILQFDGALWTNKQFDMQKLVTLSNMFFLDEFDNIFTERSFYSKKSISAYGLGAAGSGGGSTAFDRLDTWASYDAFKAGWALSAALGFDLYTSKLNKSEINSWALAATKPTYTIDEINGLRGELNSLALANHTHAISAITGLQAALDGKAAVSHSHDYLPFFPGRWAEFGYSNTSLADFNKVENKQGAIKLDGWYAQNVGALSVHGTRLTITGMSSHDKIQFLFNGEKRSIQYRKSWYPNTAWTDLRTIWDSNNLKALSQLNDDMGIRAHIANRANPHSVTALQIGASNILNELKKVDGTGSGLDADLLDGLHSSDFIFANKASNIESENTNYPHCGFGYSTKGFPISGSYISFGGFTTKNYSTQILGMYNLSGNQLWFRTRNDDKQIWNNWHRLATIQDNVASATKLQNSKTIFGKAFDGTQNVTGGAKFRNICIETGNNLIDEGFGSEINNFVGSVHIQYSSNKNITLCKGGGNVIVGNSNNSRLFVHGEIGSNAQVKCPILSLNNGWTIEASGSELHIKLNGVVKAKFISGGFVSTGGVTALG